MNTQNDRLLEYLKTHDSITQLEALNELGIFRLASRVNDLKKRGFDISGRMIFVRNRFDEEIRVKEYFLNL
jgi:hypothetical protein